MPSAALLLALVVPGVDYSREIKPLLAVRCVACHGALEQKGGLRLDTVARMKSGGDSGPAIVPGKPDDSPLWQRSAGHGGGRKMPPKGEGEEVGSADLAKIRAWISSGAQGPDREAEDPDPRDHWAFRKPRKADPPKPAGNPIDPWVAKGWKDHGLTPRPQADKLTLLRRLHLDLTGLPPLPGDIDRFLGDTAAGAYEREVERLLASPAHAERWARHFMDIWRYSDWWGLGAEVRNSQKNIWNWRDWIIEAVERDLPYDEMVRQMLAADELYPTDAAKLRATGYLARHYFLFNRTTWMDETIEHTGKAFLGLTTNCAKCHDHKYDPVRSDDYYRLRAVFEPYQVRFDAPAGSIDPAAGFPRVFDANPSVVTVKHIRGDESRPDPSRKMGPGALPFLGFARFEPVPVPLPLEASAPETRADVLGAHLAEAAKALAATRKEREETAARVRELGSSPSIASTGRAKPILEEPFDRLDDNRWKTSGDGSWKALGNSVAQTAVIPGGARLRLASPVPPDFEAVLRFKLTGGNPYRSVGLAFDVSPSLENLVYLSGAKGDPKLQVSYRKDATNHYPAEAKQSRKIELGVPIELTVRVSGPNVEALVDGQPGVVYKLPARSAGALELVTFTATVEFDHFEIRPLSAAYKPGDPVSRETTPVQLRAKLEWADADLAAKEAEPETIKARHKARADQLAGRAEAMDSARKAARLESDLAVLKARAAVAKAKLDGAVRGAPAKPGLDAALKALDDAVKAAKDPGAKFTRLSASRVSPESNLDKADPAMRNYPAASTGRRSALARWITHPDNPLTARVIVNHLWNRHFGQPLVPTVFDFGRKGSPPSHPELLDTLAVELMERGWSLRHIHRLIVTSQAYRLDSSTRRAAGESADPDNRYLWRYPSHRIESQVVRDALLFMSGRLDTARGGPSVPVTDDSSRRRSIYFVHSHNDHNRFLAQFDDAGVQECYRRSESIVPQQSLAMVHSRLAVETASELRTRIDPDGKSPAPAFVARAFRLLLAREPSAEEASACAAELSADSAAARAGLVLALLNHHDFISIR